MGRIRIHVFLWIRIRQNDLDLTVSRSATLSCGGRTIAVSEAHKKCKIIKKFNKWFKCVLATARVWGVADCCCCCWKPVHILIRLVSLKTISHSYDEQMFPSEPWNSRVSRFSHIDNQHIGAVKFQHYKT